MSKVCQVTGKRPQSGNNVSHANRKTRRRFLPNLQSKRFWLESEKRFVKLRVSHKGIRTIDKHGIEKLTTRKWTGTEDDAWAMVALAVRLCDAQGAYRGPAGPSYVFMTFGEVKIIKPEDGGERAALDAVGGWLSNRSITRLLETITRMPKKDRMINLSSTVKEGKAPFDQKSNPCQLIYH